MTLSSTTVQDAFVADMTLPFTGIGSEKLWEALPAKLRAAGFSFTSVTAAADDCDALMAFRRIASLRAHFLAQSDVCVLVDGVDDVMRAKAEGKLAVGFNFQGTVPIGRELPLVDAFYKLGIRHMLMAYNLKNFVADGCHEIGGTGLSRFGRDLVREMNRVGMFVDVAHTSHKASMDVMEFSDRPVIVSHGNIWKLHEHPRCYRDDQIQAIAKSGGVIGLTGLSIFTGDDSGSVEGYVRQLDYVAQLVGPRHVGFGFDYVCDLPALSAFAASQSARWPTDGGYARGDIKQVEPTKLGEIVEGLLHLGYNESDVRLIIGENWLRLMRQVWR